MFEFVPHKSFFFSGLSLSNEMDPFPAPQLQGGEICWPQTTRVAVFLPTVSPDGGIGRDW